MAISGHPTPHPQSGQAVRLSLRHDNPRGGLQNGDVYRIEDWWDQVFGGISWMKADGNPAAMHYAIRSAMCGLPLDDEVVYGKVGSAGHLIHVSELGEIVDD